MANDVFVSYSSKDKVVADTIVSSLETENIRCWYAPRDIEAGVDWGKAISKAIKDSKIFLLIFSGAANKSQRVLDELNFAISNEVIILPFRIENLMPRDAMMLHLSSRHWLDAYDPSWEKYLNKLTKTLSLNLNNMLIEEPAIHGKNEEIRKKKVGVGKIIIAALAGMFFLSLGWFGYSRLTTPGIDYIPTLEGSGASAKKAWGTLDISYTSNEFELDPLQIEDNESGTLAENLFLNLTNFDYSQGKIVPEAARSWSISTDGRLYTFHIRPDIPWVTHPTGVETELETDGSGETRYLTAHDFVYAIHRLCDPRIPQLPYGPYFIPMIKGCKTVNEYADAENIPTELFDEIGARAVSDTELLIELEEPAAYFLSMTSMANFAAVPQWAIEKYGDAWKSPGIIPTNGYYVIDEFNLGESLHLVRNTYLPEDLFAEGNIGKINIMIGVEESQAYEFWSNFQFDYASIPEDVIAYHLADHANEYQEISQSLYFFGFNNQKPPFDNVHVRRAFATAFDKITFVNDFKQSLGRPMNYLGIPGIVGAPSIEEIGIGYDPEYARAELAAAGYPNCEGLRQVSIEGSPEKYFPDEYLRSWERELGCPENTINAYFKGGIDWENFDIGVWVWGMDYPDENNLIANFFSCYSDSHIKRECSGIDDLILQAQVELTPGKRSDLYYQIEEGFFGQDGEYPVMPVYLVSRPLAVHSWVTPGIAFANQTAYYKWTLDIDAKNVVKSE
jgi:oligopeptide transport system substrate-binding protein